MIDLVATVSTYMVAGTLTSTGLYHLLHQQRLRDAVLKQEVFGRRASRHLAVGVTASELVVGSSIVGSLLLSGPGDEMRPILLILAAAVLASFAAYSLFLLVRRPGVSCGCSASDDPVNGLTIARSALLAIGACIGAALPTRVAEPAVSVEYSLVVLSSIALGLLLWILPQALTLIQPVLTGTRIE